MTLNYILTFKVK